MHQNHELLMLSLTRFFSKPENIEPAVSIMQGHDAISLRLVDWFVTNYAKRNNAIAVVGDSPINIYHSYRAQLETYSKHQFDPFRRHERIRFVYGDGEKAIETTVGQLYLFRWAVDNKIVDYIRLHKGAIERAMVASAAAAASAPKAKDRPKADVVQRRKTVVTFD